MQTKMKNSTFDIWSCSRKENFAFFLKKFSQEIISLQFSQLLHLNIHFFYHFQSIKTKDYFCLFLENVFFFFTFSHLLSFPFSNHLIDWGLISDHWTHSNAVTSALTEVVCQWRQRRFMLHRFLLVNNFASSSELF